MHTATIHPALSARLEKHRRMAAAAATRELLEGGDLAETCARWRAVAGGALLPGTLQQLQATIAATAAMAANLATAAGWRGVASLLDALMYVSDRLRTPGRLRDGAYRDSRRPTSPCGLPQGTR